MTDLPKAPVTRILKECGAERISKEAETLIVEAVEDWTKRFGKACIDSARHADRKTIQPEDVEFVLKHFC